MSHVSNLSYPEIIRALRRVEISRKAKQSRCEYLKSWVSWQRSVARSSVPTSLQCRGDEWNQMIEEISHQREQAQDRAVDLEE